MSRKKCYAVSVLYLVFVTTSFLDAQEISFVAIADNRSYVNEYRYVLQEINDVTVNPEPVIPIPQFLVASGDIDPVASNMAIYTDTVAYPNLPPYYPVVGNHEFETPSDMNYILNSMIPYLENIVNSGVQGTYSFDYGTVHCVVLDQYSSNEEGEVDEHLQDWLQADLNATERDHVFVFGHEPAFPRHRHIGDSLDQFPESRNAFWNMLVIDPRVRAYFCGHTHYYSRMRVLDPTTVGQSGYPDQDGGVYQVDCGAAGHSLSDGRMTIIYVHVGEDVIRFRVVTSPRNEENWEVSDDWTISGVRRVEMQLLEPVTDDEVSGILNIDWSIFGECGQYQRTTLYVSDDAGLHWDTLDTVENGETTYPWDTADYSDGTRYMIRIVVKGDSGFGMVQSEGTFVVNNPGNGAPEVLLHSPTEGDTLEGETIIEWDAADADGDLLLISFEASLDEGITWIPLVSDEPNDGVYLWDTRTMANSTHYRLNLACTDGTVWVEEISGTFAIYNEREVLSDLSIHRISGSGSGTISAHVIDETALTDHRYRVTFDDTTSEQTTYNVLDVNTEESLVDGASQMDGLTEGPLFDGIRLVVRNYSMPIADLDNTGWTLGMSDLTFSISLPEINIGNEVIRGTPYPADYEVRIDDHVVDTSSSYLGAPQSPMYFSVWNTTEDHQVDIIYIEIDGDHAISRLDEVYILEEDEGDEPILTWLLFFSGNETYVPPKAGDVFALRTLKPFTHEDVFEFSASQLGRKGDVNNDDSVNILDVMAVVRHVLDIELLVGNALWRADCTSDEEISILDVVGLVNMILGIGECVP